MNESDNEYVSSLLDLSPTLPSSHLSIENTVHNYHDAEAN